MYGTYIHNTIRYPRSYNNNTYTSARYCIYMVVKTWYTLYIHGRVILCMYTLCSYIQQIDTLLTAASLIIIIVTIAVNCVTIMIKMVRGPYPPDRLLSTTNKHYAETIHDFYFPLVPPSQDSVSPVRHIIIVITLR